MVYVHEKILDKFIEETKTYMDKYFSGSKMTKMINLIQAKRVLALLENHGGEVIYGGVKLDESIPALERTVILNPKKDSKLS